VVVLSTVVSIRRSLRTRETGKGDHRHVLEVEEPYVFSDADTLLADFWRDVEEWRR
jgi:hypothetical protein